jgi:hypothetical protein
MALQTLFHERPRCIGAERNHAELQTTGLAAG